MNRFKLMYGVLVLLCLFSCADDSSVLFTRIPAEASGVEFVNKITVTDTFNILDYEYLYNGGGVGIGDFNNDGYDDLFFTGNMVDNALYLNQGGFTFSDISDQAGIKSPGQWSSGISVVDINADGRMDVYVCNNTSEDENLRENNLYINQGLDDEGFPFFKDEAVAYGLNDNSYSVNSAFFDFDNDTDLDVIIIINEMQETRFPGRYQKNKVRKETYQRVDRLYKNVFNEEKGHAEFKDVSEQAGISVAGFSLGVNITDINQDGWQDIYITNDFLSNDLFYINQQDGTFKDEAKKYFKHTSHSAMGNDVTDINNDGLSDIIALDMLPEDNYRQKKLLGPNNYTFYINNERYGYTYQYVRNTLQLNQGMLGENEEPLFSEISLLSGVSATDWSWTPLVADFNNDGFKDIIITNGFPKDVTDHDFVDYKADAARFASKEMMLKMIPEIKSKNCGFLNRGDLSFENVTDSWGLDEVSFSNGAAYSDLDNDGDLDLVINNIDSPPFIYRNNNANINSNFIQITLVGEAPNIQALGTKIIVRNGDQLLTYVHSPFRGYLSTHTQKAHIGLGELKKIEKIEVYWPDGRMSTLNEVDINTELDLYQKEAGENDVIQSKQATILHIDTSFIFRHEEDDYVDYNVQPLLPHKLSEYGPGLSVADVDNNGLEDIYVSGPTFHHGRFLMQYDANEFTERVFVDNDSDMEELGTLFFDADGDSDLDMYIVSGSYEKKSNDSILIDRLYEYDNGTFIVRPSALPNILHNGLNVKAADFDRDGDLDLVVGGRIKHGQFPEALNSYLYQNNSDAQSISFSNVTNQLANTLLDIGMVTDMLWTDFNQDGWVDLIVLAEFSELIFLENKKGTLEKISVAGTKNKKGFWNSIQGADLDNDGDIDYVLGNRGLNQFNPITAEFPFRFYVSDFDRNGSTDVLPFSYFKNRENEYEEFPFMSRLDFTKEINSARRKFQSFESYSTATKEQVIPDSLMADTDIYEANYVYTSILRNQGEAGFSLEALPTEAQLAPVYGSQLHDLNDDGWLDIILVGNDYGNEIFFGRQDALNGVCLLSNQNGSYDALLPGESGYLIPGNAKSIAKIFTGNQLNFVTGENRGPISLHHTSSVPEDMLWTPERDDFIITYMQNDHKVTQELYYGSGFLSQSSRKITIPSNVTEILVQKFNGQERTINDFN